MKFWLCNVRFGVDILTTPEIRELCPPSARIYMILRSKIDETLRTRAQLVLDFTKHIYVYF